MADTFAKSQASRRLSELLVQQSQWSLEDRLLLVQKLALQVRALHENGRTHRAIGAENVSIDEKLRSQLEPPAGPRPFGGEEGSDPEFCPPELAGGETLELPEAIEAAAAVLKKHGHQFDPRCVDVYQLGVLLCRLLIGEPILAYMYDPRIKAKVPAFARALLDRALGHDAENRFESCDGLLAALDEAVEQAKTARTPDSMHETPARGSVLSKQADTPPRGNKPSVAPQDAEPLPFDRLGHFQILGRIGHGGMGDVYRGYDESLDRQVAVKVLPPELARDEDFVRRFHAEATAAAKVAHPNVVPVYFIGEDAGYHFFAMQFIEGESLSDRLKQQQRLPLDETLQIIQDCLAGLSVAHDRGLIHRDIKPGNILLERETGRAMLVDFGLVRTMGQAERMTATGMVMGTVDYIAPEQARGKQVDGRADLYALGVLTYQLLAGRLPFEAETPTAMIFQHAYEDPYPLGKAAPHLPQPVLDLVARMMAKDPADRYPSAAEVLADIEAFREGRPLAKPTRVESPDDPTTTLPSSPELMQEPELPDRLDELADDGLLRRARDWAATMFRRHAPQFVKDLQSTTQQVDAAVAEYERRQRRLALLRDEAHSVMAELAEQITANRQAAAAAAEQAQEAAGADQAEAALARQQQWEEHLAALEWQYAEQRRRLEEIELQVSKADATLARLHSQRDALKARLRAAATRQEMEGGRPSRRHPHRLLIAAAVGCSILAASLLWLLIPGGADDVPDFIAVPDRSAAPRPGAVPPTLGPGDSASGVVTVELLPPASPGPPEAESPEMRLLGTLSTSDVRRVAFTPDGSILAVGGKDRTLGFWDMETRQLGGLQLQLTDVAGDITFSPDGSLLAVADGNDIRLLDAATHMLRKALPGETTVRSLAFSPDGSTLAAGNSDETVCLWETAAGRLRWTKKTGTKDVWSVAFSPDGSMVATVGGECTEKLWDAATGRLLRTLKADRGANQLSFSPDGATLLSARDTVLWFWDVATGTVRRKIEPHIPGGVNRFAFHPDGMLLASAGSSDARFKIWSLPDPTLLRTFDGYVERVGCLAFSPDGSLLVANNGPILQLWGVGAAAAPPASLEKKPVPQGKDRLLAFEFLGAIQPGNTYIREITFGPDDSTLLLATRDAGVQYLDIATRQARAKLPLPKEFPSAFALSLDGSLLAAAYEDGSVTLHDASTGRLRAELAGHVGAVRSVAFSPDGETLASAAEDDERPLIFWDPNTGQPRCTPKGHTGSVWDVTFSPDGSTVASAGEDKSVRLWDAFTGEPRQTCEHRQLIAARSVAFKPDGSMLASGDANGTVALWDVATGQVRRILEKHDREIACLAFYPDGSMLASGSGGELHLHDVATGRLLNGFRERHGPPVESIDFSPDGSFMACGGGNTIKLWRVLLSTNTLPRSDAVTAERPALDRKQEPPAVSPVTESDAHLVAQLSGHADEVLGVAFAPDEKRVASCGADGTVRLWDVAAGKEIRRFSGHRDAVEDMDFSPDGRFIVTCSRDAAVVLWNVETGQEARRFEGHTGPVRSVDFAEDIDVFVTGGDDGKARIWDVKNTRPLEEADCKEPISTVAISPGGNYGLATLPGQKLTRFYHADPRNFSSVGVTPSPAKVESQPEAVQACKFVKIDRQLFALVSCGEDPANGKNFVIRLWGLQGAGLFREYQGHTGTARALDVSADGSRFVSAGDDKTVRLWDIEAEREIYCFPGHQGSVRAVALSDDKRLIVSGSTDNTVRVWRVPGAEKLSAE